MDILLWILILDLLIVLILGVFMLFFSIGLFSKASLSEKILNLPDLITSKAVCEILSSLFYEFVEYRTEVNEFGYIEDGEWVCLASDDKESNYFNSMIPHAVQLIISDYFDIRSTIRERFQSGMDLPGIDSFDYDNFETYIHGESK
jgi:hypothetical protein